MATEYGEDYGETCWRCAEPGADQYDGYGWAVHEHCRPDRIDERFDVSATTESEVA